MSTSDQAPLNKLECTSLLEPNGDKDVTDVAYASQKKPRQSRCESENSAEVIVLQPASVGGVQLTDSKELGAVCSRANEQISPFNNGNRTGSQANVGEGLFAVSETKIGEAPKDSRKILREIMANSRNTRSGCHRYHDTKSRNKVNFRAINFESLGNFVNWKLERREDNSQPSISQGTSNTSYGTINFMTESVHDPLYINLNEQFNNEAVFQLMTQHWKLSVPDFILNVIENVGDSDFSSGGINELFKKDLLSTVMDADVWILTSGFNTGTSALIGQAMKECLETSESLCSDKLAVIGIASLSSVAGSDRLKREQGHGCFHAPYPLGNILPKENEHVLDPNHTHFVLLGDNVDKSFKNGDWKIDFVDFVTEYISQKTDRYATLFNAHQKIPTITLLMSGNDVALAEVAGIVNSGKPLIAIAGSGGAADVVTEIVKSSEVNSIEWTENNLNEIYSNVMSRPPPHDVGGYLKDILKKVSQVVVCYVTKSDGSDEGVSLQRAMLSALFPNTNPSVEDTKHQLMLALMWDHVQFAKDTIFSVSRYKQLADSKDYLALLFFLAILRDQVSFVALLADNNYLNLQDFLTEDSLMLLYEQAIERSAESISQSVRALLDSAKKNKECRTCCACFSRSTRSEEKVCLPVIGRAIKGLVRSTFSNIYKDESVYAYEGEELRHDGTNRFHNPALHLFLWALMFNRFELAKYFFKKSKDHIVGAIVGTAILKSLAKWNALIDQLELSELYDGNAKKFEFLANGILDVCWDKDKQLTLDLLIRSNKNWSCVTVLSVAYISHMEEFIAKPACYLKLRQTWRGDISLNTAAWKILLFCAVPVFGVFNLKFVTRDQEGNVSSAPLTLSSPFDCKCFMQRTEDIGYCKALKKASQAPFVKFVWCILSYVIFLAAYSVFITSELAEFNIDSDQTSDGGEHNSSQATSSSGKYGYRNYFCIGICEIITYIWFLVYFFDEIRQMQTGGGIRRKTFSQNFSYWFMDFWNKIDCISCIVFLTAVGLRFTVNEPYFVLVRWLFCLSFAAYIARFMQMFFVIEEIGPKVIMIAMMLKDLMFFVFILLVVMLGYGVITEAIINPTEHYDWELLGRIFYRPYWQMYGELSLEDYKFEYQKIFLVFYMLFSNILLLNLLIAMFNNTYSNVSINSQTVWRYHYYAIVKEHFDRPTPLALGFLVQLFKCCCRRIRKERIVNDDDFCRDFHIFDKDHDKKLTMFVNWCTNIYFNRVASERISTDPQDDKLTKLEEEQKLLVAKMSELVDKVNVLSRL